MYYIYGFLYIASKIDSFLYEENFKKAIDTKQILNYFPLLVCLIFLKYTFSKQDFFHTTQGVSLLGALSFFSCDSSSRSPPVRACVRAYVRTCVRA